MEMKVNTTLVDKNERSRGKLVIERKKIKREENIAYRVHILCNFILFFLTVRVLGFF